MLAEDEVEELESVNFVRRKQDGHGALGSVRLEGDGVRLEEGEVARVDGASRWPRLTRFSVSSAEPSTSQLGATKVALERAKEHGFFLFSVPECAVKL